MLTRFFATDMQPFACRHALLSNETCYLNRFLVTVPNVNIYLFKTTLYVPPLKHGDLGREKGLALFLTPMGPFPCLNLLRV